MNTDNIFFNLCHPILDKLSDGKTLKLGFRIYFYVFGVLAMLAGLFAGFQLLDADINLWTIILFLAFSFTGWMIFQICWYRAKSIKNVPDSEYVVSAIFSIFIRSIGEIAATIFVVVGFVSGLVALLSDVRNEIAEAGPVAMVVGPIAGFLVIALFYFIAERLSALPAIAVNTSKDSELKKTPTTSGDLLDN